MLSRIAAAAVRGAVLPGSPGALTARRCSRLAASRSTPPGAEARSSRKQSSRSWRSRLASNSGAGTVLKIKSNPSRCPDSRPVCRHAYPHTDAQARSPYRRADTVTCAPRACRRWANRRPIRPQPVTRHRLPWMVRSVASIARAMAPSAVGTALTIGLPGNSLRPFPISQRFQIIRTEGDNCY